jgi:hypothetical protein
VFGSLERYEKASKLSKEKFKQVTGVKKETFDIMNRDFKARLHCKT